jgi:hypothetical protein
VLEFVDKQLAVGFFLDQPPGDPPLLHQHRAILPDAPDGDRADAPIQRQKGEPGAIDEGIAEIDDDAEHPAGQRGDDADPEPAEGCGKEDGREVRDEVDVRSDLRQTPARQCRDQQAGDGECKAQPEGRLCLALPALAEFLGKLAHAPPGRAIRPDVEPRTRMLRIATEEAKLALPMAGGNSGSRGAGYRRAVFGPDPAFGSRSFKSGNIP